MSWSLSKRSLQIFTNCFSLTWGLLKGCGLLLETPICRTVPNEPNPEWSGNITKVKKGEKEKKQEATLTTYSYRLPWTPNEMFGFEERNWIFVCAVRMLKKLVVDSWGCTTGCCRSHVSRSVFMTLLRLRNLYINVMKQLDSSCRLLSRFSKKLPLSHLCYKKGIKCHV